MQKISKNTKGSQMYFMQALVHLMDLGVFKVEKGSLAIEKSETVVFPTTLDELVQKRLLFIKKYTMVKRCFLLKRLAVSKF